MTAQGLPAPMALALVDLYQSTGAEKPKRSATRLVRLSGAPRGAFGST